MPIRECGIKGLTRLGAVSLVLAAPAVIAQEYAKPDEGHFDACSEIVSSHFKQVYPRAKRFAWDLSRLTTEESPFGDLLKGGGSFRGKGGKPRTFEFECTYDPYQGRVVKARWESSKDPGEVRLVVDETNDMEIMPGEVAEACVGGIDGLIRETWPEYQEVELVEESLDRRKTREGYLLRGEGRFLGRAGAWHRYDFKCMFDGEDADVTWKHHGKEEVDE